MKKSQEVNMKKTVYEWRRLSYRLLIVSCLLFAAACWLGYELDSMIYFYILAAGGFLFMLASAIVYYEFWRCPKCDAKLPNESAFFGEFNCCPYCGYKLRNDHDQVDTNLL